MQLVINIDVHNIDVCDWGSIASISDPFGHGLCLMQLTDTGYDAAA